MSVLDLLVKFLIGSKNVSFNKFDPYKIEDKRSTKLKKKKILLPEECGLYTCVYVSTCMYRFVCVGYPSNMSISPRLKVSSDSTYIKRGMLRMLKDKLLTKFSRATNSENVTLKASFYSPLPSN